MGLEHAQRCCYKTAPTTIRHSLCLIVVWEMLLCVSPHFVCFFELGLLLENQFDRPT